MLITLAVVVLFSGYFILKFDDGQAEELLGRSAAGVKGLALKAKKRAFAYRREHYVIFSPTSILLSDSGLSSDASESSAIQEVVEIPEGVKMELMPPGQAKWIRAGDYVWTFRDSGLSDPIRVRFSFGKSYTTLSFNVLTALAEEETFLE
tara:strand:- start:59 stop:508 length:450 start_codon:yes stop_codon:yes gene_type:complete